MYIQTAPNSDRAIKVYLYASERSALQSLINLPDDLSPLIKEQTFIFNEEQFDFASRVTPLGYILFSHPIPIVWLNTPESIKLHLKNGKDVKLIYRTAAIEAEFPYFHSTILIHRIPQSGA